MRAFILLLLVVEFHHRQAAKFRDADLRIIFQQTHKSIYLPILYRNAFVRSGTVVAPGLQSLS